MALKALMDSIGVPEAQSEAIANSSLVQQADQEIKRKVKRKKSAYDRALKKALKQVNDTVRTKNGSLRKGVTQAMVMKRAHKLARKMIK